MGPKIVYLQTVAAYNSILHDPRNIYLIEETGQFIRNEVTYGADEVINFVDNVPESLDPGEFYFVNRPADAQNNVEALQTLLWSDGTTTFDLLSIVTAALSNATIDHSVFVTNTVMESFVNNAIADFATREQAQAYAKEAVDGSVDGLIEDASDQAYDDLFEKVKAAGYVGTRGSFPQHLAVLLNEINNIVIAENHGAVPAVQGVSSASLAEALNSVASGQTATLVADATVDGPITLNGITLEGDDKLVDLGNKTVSLAGTSAISNINLVENSDAPNPSGSGNSIVVTPNATATLTNVDIDTTTYQALVFEENSNAVLENVTINSSLDGSYAATAYDSKSLVIANKNNTMEFKSGEIIATTSTADDCGLYGIYSVGGGSIVLGNQETGEGPTFITNSAPIGTNNLDGGIDNITIYGGTYKSLMSHTGFMGVMYLGAGANVEIFGGTFDGGEYDIALPYRPAAYTVRIHGGTFNGSVETIKKDFKAGGGGTDTNNDQDVIEIDGGNFAVEVPAEYIKEGYECVTVGTRFVVQAIA